MSKNKPLDKTEDLQLKLTNETFKELEFDSVLKFISNRCYSDLGKEIINKLKPVDDLNFLNQELNLVDETKNLILFDEELPLFGLSDIRHLIYKSKIENAVLNSTEILSIADMLKVFRLIKFYFHQKEDKYPNLINLMSGLHENRIIEKHINDAIDQTGEVRDNATRELFRLRNDIKDKSNRLRSKLQKILKKVSEDEIIQDDFFSVRDGRFVLPVKAENKRTVPGIIHSISQTGSTVFLEPAEIIDLNNELNLLMNEERREVYKILSNLTAEIGDDANFILQSVEIIGHFDSIISRSRYAIDFGGIKPIVSEDNEIYIKQVRHPILVQSKGSKSVIPLSIEFSHDKRGHLISGPNAGGKTVALKSIGLNIIMALSGIFPLGELRTNFRTVYSAIGDHQSIENDLSTFSSQMLQLKEILDICDSKSLVLIDEIGSGTDPQEGAALASGILDTFLELNLFFIATTHQSSLKTYALTRTLIQNASLEFDQNKLKPTYKFLAGIPGNSYAFVLAESIGFSKLVLDRSKNYLGDKHKEIEESIAILQQYRLEATKNKIDAEQEKLKFEKLKADYEIKINGLKNTKNQMLSSAKIQAANIVNSANSLIENTIREIREEKKSYSEIKQEFQEKKEEIIKEVKKVEKALEKNVKDKEEILLGDYVLVDDSPNVGFVVEIDEKNALVEINDIKFKLKIKQLTKTKPPTPKTQLADFIKFDINSRLDVRGKRADETIRELDEFIHTAIVNNLDHLTILHGKGTGALKIAIHRYLKDHPSVINYRLGELVEGGAGVTIVTI